MDQSDQSEVAKFVSGFRGLAAVTQPLGPQLLSEFAEAERMRQNIEQRWLMDLRQYRGIYEPEVMARLGNRSKVFSKKTRVKVRAINDRVFDLEFPDGSEKNFEVSPTPEPEISPKQKEKLIEALKAITGQDPDAKQIRRAVMEYSKAAAARMTNVITDQLIEAQYRRIAKLAIHSGNLYGTGVIKGPLVDIRLKTRFTHTGEKWDVEEKEHYSPFVDHVPLWRFFPDMAATDIKDCRYVWERHRLTKSAILELSKNPSFDADTLIRYSLNRPTSAQRKSYETEVRRIGLQVDLGNDGSYELLERWGWIDAEQLLGCDLGVEVVGMVFANIWMTPQGEVVKFAPQPIKGQLYPYHLYYFDRDETSIFGEGLATIMRDEQDALNSSRRATFDNLAITAGPQIEANADLMDINASPEEMGPFAIWWRTGDGQFPAIRIINADSQVNELSAVSAVCDNEIDEVTGVPKYLYGDGPNRGAGATAMGLSQLLGQANVSVKAQVQEYDDGVTSPFIQGLVAWNMQFNADPSIKGDYAVHATGTKSLVAKEVRSQMLANFTATLTPAETAYIKFDKLIAEKAKAHDLSDIVKTQEEFENEQKNNPASQMQMQMMQMQAQLSMQKMQAEIGKIGAEMQKLIQAANLLKAQTLRSKVDSEYAAMQTGAVIAANPHVAAIGDAALQEAGWEDAQPQTSLSQSAEQLPPMPTSAPEGTSQPQSPFTGVTQGIETAEVPQ